MTQTESQRWSGRLAFIDTETLGLNPDRHAIWEVAVIVYDPLSDEVEARWRTQIELTITEMADADPVALDMNGFRGRYSARAPQSKVQAMTMLTSLTEGCHLAGANPAFDEERLRRLCQRVGVEPNWHYHLIDVENLALGALAANGVRIRPPYTSAYLRDEFGVEVDPRLHHSALSDAQWALDLFRAVDPDPRSVAL